MTKRELLDSSLADVPDDELVFVVRGSHPAAPETLREYGRRVLHYERLKQYPLSDEGAQLAKAGAVRARSDADAAFNMADRMEQGDVHQQRMVDERRAGLTANDDDEQLRALAGK